MSDLLTIREKGVLFTLLEPQCKLIKTTVAQVLMAKDTQVESPGWSCLGCGALCLVEDETIHSYFLRLYSVKHAKLLWEQELYIPFKYTAARMFFHTFPGDDHQVGLNFANETEAEEFHLAVETVQRNQGEMTWIVAEEDSSTSDPPDSGTKQLDHLDGEQYFPIDLTPTPTTSSFMDRDNAIRRLLMQANLTAEDLKDKDVAEAVDCIINQFGGLKAVQRELRNRGPVSQTMPRSAGASISLALKKGPLPPVPSIKRSTSTKTSQQTPKGTDTLSQSPPWIPPPSHAPVVPERMRKRASFKQVGSLAAADRCNHILNALREVEVARHKKQLQ